MSSEEVKNCFLSYFMAVIFLLFVTFGKVRIALLEKRTVQGTLIKIVVAPMFEELLTSAFLAILSNHQRKLPSVET